ncbi:MAG: hypothetical protein K9M97_04410, partial [Akkermansiaceae bacterium]|nr:hypothetical protein [Akkermansiaceae bacterium]
ASLRFAVAASAEERRGEPPDAGYLKELASLSHGGYFSLEAADQWLEALPKPDRQTERVVVSDAWNHPLAVIVLLGCLAAEWWLRRRRGLA